jgi:tRNA(fMet)-specific endonuclease VapC
MHLDTSFAIDLMRERSKRRDGPATQWLHDHVDEELRVGVHVACELLAGARLAPHPAEEETKVRRVLDAVVLTYPDERFAPAYAEILSWATRHGTRVAAMDTLIAAEAIAESAPLVTRNVKDFERIPGLRVETY